MPSGSSDQCAVQFTLENLSITACFAVVFCVSFIGNVVVILTIARRHVQQFQSITNLYLLNLAIADLLRSVICMPSTLLSELSHCWLLGPFFCTAAAYLQPATVCASEYTLVVIAVERFYAICRPLQSRKWRSKQRALWMIFFVWIVSFVSNIGSIFIFEAVPYKNAWNCISIGEPLFDFFYQFYVTLILFLIPLAVMVFLYGHIITTLNRGTRLDSSFIPLSHHRPFHVPTDFGRRLSSPVPRNSGRDPSMQSTTPPAQRASMSAIYAATLVVPMHFSRPRTSSLHVPGEEQQYRSLQPTSSRSIDCTCFLRSNNQDKALSAVKKANRMLIALVILFAICWMPSFVWWMFVRTGDLLNQRIWSDSVNTVITILTYISTCTNPLTYCFLNQSFRQSLIQHLSGATVLKAKRIRRPSTFPAPQTCRKTPPPCFVNNASHPPFSNIRRASATPFLTLYENSKHVI